MYPGGQEFLVTDLPATPLPAPWFQVQEIAALPTKLLEDVAQKVESVVPKPPKVSRPVVS